MAPAGLRVIGYVRASTDEQAHTLSAQEAIIRRIAGQRDWTVIDVLVDRGVSGAATVRPAREEAIARIEAGEADALICTKLDRLTRSIVDFGEVLERAKSSKWAVVLLDPEIDMTTSAGELMANILVSVAQFERSLISERTKTGLEAAKAKGAKIGRPRKVSDEIVARIHREVGEGKSFNAIATGLNRDGVPTAQGGAAWYASTVKYLVQGDKR